MSDEELFELEDVPEPTWKERLAAIKRAGAALFGTRAAIFREEIAAKRSHFSRAAISFGLAASFAILALLVLTALVAAVLSNWLGGPIAGLAATFFLYVVIIGAAGFFGNRSFGRVRPFDFPITRDELHRDLEALSAEAPSADDAPAGAPHPDALAAERASVPPEEPREEEEEVELEEPEPESLEQRFRVGSE